MVKTSYVLQQWSNMQLSTDKSYWGKNNSDYNNRPELGQYKIVCCYTSNPEIYSVISLNTRPYDLSLDEEALQKFIYLIIMILPFSNKF